MENFDVELSIKINSKNGTLKLHCTGKRVEIMAALSCLTKQLREESILEKEDIMLAVALGLENK